MKHATESHEDRNAIAELPKDFVLPPTPALLAGLVSLRDDEKERAKAEALVRTVPEGTELSFEDLVRCYAYLQGNFDPPYTFEEVCDPKNFVIRNDLAQALLPYGFSPEEALDFAKHGVWRNNKPERREENCKNLREKGVPEEIIRSFARTSNLWRREACVTRLIPLCRRWAEEYKKQI